MNTYVACEHCGRQYAPANVLGQLCPVCLFSQVLTDDAQVTESAVSSNSTHARFLPPKIHDLAPYFPQMEILELAGQGGMSAVYRVRQTHLDRTVALKILPQEIASTSSGLERFQQEAQTLARLKHPNIVDVFDAGQAGPWCFIVMEFVAGPNLRQLLGESKLPASEVLNIVAEICDGLQHAHDHGVVHRDIKPENVLLDRSGRVKLVDFGLAKLLAPVTPRQFSTESRQVMGTPHYLSPEQMEASANVDHRADLYALGVMMYEMLTGELPIGHFEPPSRRAGSDPALDAVVLRAMERDRSQRYQQARDMKRGMTSFVAQATYRAAPRPTRPRFGNVTEWLLSTVAILSVLFGCLSLAKAVKPRLEFRMEAILAVSAFAIGFVLARVNVALAKRRMNLSVAQRACIPILIPGYAVLGLLLLLGPGLAVILLGGFPLLIEQDHWSVFGHVFSNADRFSLATPYWLSILGVCALLSTGWSLVVAYMVHSQPSLSQHMLHPFADEAASLLTRTVAFFAAAILLPVGCALLYASWIMQ